MSVTINRSSHPCLWGVFSLVRASLDFHPDEEVVEGVHEDDVAAFELGLSAWSYSDVLVLAGIVEDDARFDELVATEVGGFVNHALAMD